MAEVVSVLAVRMRDNLFLSDNGMDSIETESQGSRDENMDRDPGFVEERFRVDRKKLEQMLQLVTLSDDTGEGADDFFQRVMEQTNTQITWPSKLKIGAKSKKDPHIKVTGYPENVTMAKSKIMAVLDTKSIRVTLKMDVSHTEHSHVIGKGGNNIKRVMMETGCHIHFPDSNRGNNTQDKSNQVSIAGQPEGVETARSQIRVCCAGYPPDCPLDLDVLALDLELLPLVFMFELPAATPLIPVPDVTSSFIQQLQQTHNVTINFKQRPRTYATTAIVRGSVHSAKGVKQATAHLMEQLAGNISLTVSMQLEIAPQHHMFIIGRGGFNIKHIMQQTGANILFPDPNMATPQRKGTVFIHGNIESAFLARQHLIGCLPLVLMFDVKDNIELDQGMISQLMETLDVYISVKPKPKQPSKSVIVKSIERNAVNMYLTREILLGLKSDTNISSHHLSLLKGRLTQAGPTALSLAGLRLLSPRILSVNTTNFMLNGQSGLSGVNPAMNCPPSPVVSPNQWLAQSSVPAIFSPLMVVTPASNVDVLSSNRTTNGFRHDFSNSAFMRIPTPLECGPSSNNSTSTSPTHSSSTSPTTVGLCNTAADLASLQKSGTLGEALSHDTATSLLVGPVHLHHRHHHQHPMDLLGLSKTSSLTQLSSLAQCSSPTTLCNGITHPHQHFINGDKLGEPPAVDDDPSDKLAPGIERKTMNPSLFSSPFQFDYEQKKLLAMRAMQKKPEGESRIPTDIWAGMGFSKSMPESAIRDKLGQMGISARVTDTSLHLGYEASRPEIDLNIDKDLWNDDRTLERGPANRPLNKAPGEYPSPRKKFQYLSHSNHVDSARLPRQPSVWSATTDLAELFSALGLGKYTDLFQQQEIDLATFLTLSDHDLRELGISTFGARRKMLLAIADLNKRRTLTPSTNCRMSSVEQTRSDVGHTNIPGSGSSPGRGGGFTAGGNSASELFPSPNPAPSLMAARGGPDLGNLSGHW